MEDSGGRRPHCRRVRDELAIDVRRSAGGEGPAHGSVDETARDSPRQPETARSAAVERGDLPASAPVRHSPTMAERSASTFSGKHTTARRMSPARGRRRSLGVALAATCALGLAPAPLTELQGRARGHLAIVGIGPGQSTWRTPEASKLIAEAEVVWVVVNPEMRPMRIPEHIISPFLGEKSGEPS